MNWFALAIISVFGTTLSNIYRRVAMKDDDSDTVLSAIIFQFLGGIMVGSVALVRGFEMPPLSQYPLNFFLNASLWGIATLFLFNTYRYVEASEATIITTLETIVAIFASLLFLNEHFDLIKIIGTVMIIFSVAYVSYSHKKWQINKGVLYAVGYSLFAGLGIANDAFLTRRSEPLSYLTIAFFLPGIFMLLTQFNHLKLHSSLFKRANLKNTFLLTFFYVLAAIAWFLAISKGGQASQITPINQSSIILTIVIAALFLKERDALFKKLVCAVLVAIGVILLS